MTELEKYIQHGDLKYRGLESELSAAYIVDMMSTIRKLVKKDIYEGVSKFLKYNFLEQLGD